LKPSQFKDTTATKMNGLFKPSILPMTDDYQKVTDDLFYEKILKFLFLRRWKK